MQLNNYELTHLRDSLVLSNTPQVLSVLGSYIPGVANGQDVLNGQPNLNNQLILYVHLTLGSLTTAEVTVEFSHDGETNWVQETFDSINGTTGVVTEVPMVRTFGATGNFRIPIKINDQHIRVTVHGTGTVTGSLMAVDAILGNN